MIRKDDILEATEYGKTVILYYYPQAAAGFTSKRNFRIRPDGSDRKPSGTVFFKENMWFLQDKGGGDNKAYNAITLVMEKEGLGFPQAIDWIAAKFAPHLLSPGSAPAGKPEPRISPAAPSDTVTVNLRPGGRFTERELALLGWKITQDICGHFSLKPVDSYVTRRNSRGKSFRIEATESYPIYYYDYGTWGKLYQPLGEVRFMYVGSKPEGWIFGDDRFRRLYDAAAAGRLSTVPDPEDVDEYTADTVEDERMERLIICSGPSDAINAYAAGFNVCWPNSESEDPDPLVMSRLFRIAKDVYICYDIDETGLRNMYRIALQWLNLYVLRLPEDLAGFKARGGKSCKDIKDYMMFYRRKGRNNPHKSFADLAATSSPLKFWIMYDKGKDGCTYDIDNIPMFRFLEASGFCRIPSPSDRKGFRFCRIQGNKVVSYTDDQIAAAAKKHLQDYLKENTVYYTRALERSIERSRQITLAGLAGLAEVRPDFHSWSRDEEWVFFRNTAVRVTAEAIETVPAERCPFHILQEKVVDGEFSVEKPLFDIRRTPEAAELLAAMETARCDHGPRSPEYLGLRKRYDGLTELERWTARMLRDDCTFMQYVWNTGRTYWRKEELGLPLEEAEVAETELNFVNKCMALGYLLCKYKDASKPYAVYCMEMQEGTNGEHNGGTGKSLFAKSIDQVRCQLFINGQDYDPKDTKFMLQEVKKDITDNIFMDDLSTRVDLHKFMPMITGDMTVNPKYVPAFTIKYQESPKVIFTSNHAIRNFDSSLRRRTFFTAFSDYYHADNPERKMTERTPATDFGKQLIYDYDDKEMNTFYNFMLQCLQLWMRYRVRVNPPMQSIERRTLRNSLGDEFLWWAEEYFNEAHLDREVDKREAFEAYLESISERESAFRTMRTFTDQLRRLCAYKGWTYTPERLLKSESERKRGDIRRQVDGKDRYFFYISTHEEEEAVDESEPPFPA